MTSRILFLGLLLSVFALIALAETALIAGEKPQRHQGRERLPHPDDTSEYLIPHDLIRRVEGAGAYDAELIAELRRLKEQMTNPIKRACLALIITSQEINVNSPVSVCRVRARYRQLANEHPGTWISFSAKMGLAENYFAIQGFSQMKHEAYMELLTDLEKSPLDPSDPFLDLWPMDRDSRRITEEPRDFVLWRIVEAQAFEWDLEEAERVAAKIESKHWQVAAARPLDRLRALSPDDLLRRQQHDLTQPPQRGPRCVGHTIDECGAR